MNTCDPPSLWHDHSRTATSHAVSLVSSRIPHYPLLPRHEETPLLSAGRSLSGHEETPLLSTRCSLSHWEDTLICWMLTVSLWEDSLTIHWTLAVRRLHRYTLYYHSVSVRRLLVLLWTLVLCSTVSFLKTSTLFQTMLCVSFCRRQEKVLVVCPFNSKALA